MVGISPDGRWLLAGDECGGVLAWDLAVNESAIAESRQTLNTFPPVPVTNLSFSPDSHWVASAHGVPGRMAMGTVVFWDLRLDEDDQLPPDVVIPALEEWLQAQPDDTAIQDPLRRLRTAAGIGTMPQAPVSD